MADGFIGLWARGPLRRLLHSLAKLVATFIEIGETRLSLLAIELQEEVYRAAGFLLYAVTAISLATIGLVMAAFALVIAFWDSHRLLVSLLVSGGFVVASLFAVLVPVIRLRSLDASLHTADDGIAAVQRYVVNPLVAVLAVAALLLLRRRPGLGPSFHVGAPSQPRIRRIVAQTLHLPSSPMTRRPPGLSTRAISSIARSACWTKQSTVTATTRSNVP